MNTLSTRSVAMVASMMGKKDVEVVVGNYDTASTDGKIIKLPLISGENALTLIRGYVDHESGHVKYTDFNFFPTPDFKGYLLNIIEDIRVEKAMGKAYIGSVKNLRDLSTVLTEIWGLDEVSPNPSSAILQWVQSTGRVNHLGHDSMKRAKDNTDVAMRSILGSKYSNALQLIDKIGSLQLDLSGTKEAVALRDEFMQLLADTLKDLQTPPPPQPPNPEEQKDQEENQQQQDGSPDNQNSNDSDQGDQAEDGSSSDSDSEKSSSSSSATSSDSAADSKEKANATGGQGAGKGKSDLQKKRAIAALKEALSADQIDFKDLKEVLQAAIADAVNNTSSVEKRYIPRRPQVINSSKESPFPDLPELKRLTAKARAKFVGEIQATKPKKTAPKSCGNRIDTRHLSRLSMGDTRVFIQKEEKKAVNTAIVLCLDGSSSMHRYDMQGTKMWTAIRSIYIALEALQSIPGVKTSAIQFNEEQNEVTKLCDWGQKPDSGRFNHNSDGGTPLSAALWHSWCELLARPEPRKICFVFSDGDANHDDIEPSKSAILQMQSAGIEVLGVGIQNSALRAFLPRTTEVISELAELTPAVLRLLKGSLVK